MRKFVFFIISAFLSSMIVLTGCTQKDVKSSDSLGVDTLATDTVDSISNMLGETVMPSAADELFDDFFFNFAASRKIQDKRIKFPLAVNNFGKISTISQKEWKTEHFFMKQGYYTLIFTAMSQLNAMKDTTVNDVTVERIAMDKGVVRQWHFVRTGGLWQLYDIRNLKLRDHYDSSFLLFYQKFSSDAEFQQSALAESVTFTGPDPEDDFSTMTGEILPEQWPMFAPQLPSGTIYNIVYGEAQKMNSTIRYFLIRGIANGLQTDLVFSKRGSSWELTKITT